MLLRHGTCAALAETIEREGLVQPFPGRGVALVRGEHEPYAIDE